MKIKTNLFILCASFFLLNSCKKDDTTPPAATPEELLTKSLWKIDEIRYAQVNTSGGGASYYYKRGITPNIGGLDTESLLFATNNTGTYTYGTTTAPFTWQFTDAGKTKIQWIITYSPTNILTVNWENVAVTANTLKYGEYFTTSGGITSIGLGTHVH
jgi:hypothetical protein